MERILAMILALWLALEIGKEKMPMLALIVPVFPDIGNRVGGNFARKGENFTLRLNL
jgi:uncharacterized membrane protein YccC